MLSKLLPRHHGLAGTLKYLFAPIGEHTDPHLVAAWDSTLLEFDDTARPSAVERRELVRRLDAPRRLRDKHVAAGHVLHVPLSAHAQDGLLGDAVWRELTEEFVARLGLGRCRWVAVHHGTSTANNDYVHLVVQLVGEDGRVARLDHSKRKARAWAVEVEQRLGLVRTGPSGTGARKLTRAEHERARRTGVEPHRRTLERRVRAAAAGSTGPGEFVDVLARAGVRVTPVTGDDGRVTGYRVALAEDQVLDAGPALRLGGGQLARDLTWPELVDRWRASQEVLVQDAGPDRTKRAVDVGDPAAWVPGSTWPMRGGNGRWAMARRHLFTAAGLLDRVDLDDPVHRYVAVEQAAQFTAVLALRWPVDRDDDYQRQVADAVRRAADDLAAATRLWQLSPTRRTPQPWPLLPVLATLARSLARTGEADLVLVLLVVAALAVLVIALADRVTGTGRPAPVRGEPGAHLRVAADHLRPYQRRTTAIPTTMAENPAARVVDVEQRLAASQAQLIKRPVPGINPCHDAGPTRRQ